MFRELVKQVLGEIVSALESVTDAEAEAVVSALLDAEKIVVHGAGRVGLACKGFAMRLAHLGLHAFSVTDAAVPPVGKNDVVLLASSSGETQTVYDVEALGKQHGARIVLVTGSPKSRMTALADHTILVKAQTKFGPSDDAQSIQPMATQFEQSLQVFFDVLVLMLMRRTRQAHSDLWNRHSNLD
ncbi:MAG: hypothetical protein C4326_07280 [Ignavibacteria bacterium]